jgi:hypothetical protein
MNIPLPKAITLYCSLLVLVGCARLESAGMFAVSSNMGAIAIVNGQVLQGDVSLNIDRTGALVLKASAGDKGPIGSCSGRLRFTAKNSGSMDLRCNDGTNTELTYQLLSASSGYAYGMSPDIPVSLTFGLSMTQARAFLAVPTGKKLVEAGSALTIENQ